MTLLMGDCLEILKDLETDSVDLVITSPPYDNIEGAGYTQGAKDILFLKLYSEFMDSFFEQIYRVLKPTGQFYLNVKSGTGKKKLVTPHWLEFLESFKKFKFKSYIIWKYSGSFDSTKSRYHLDYEVIYHLSKTDDIKLHYEKDEIDPLTSVWNIPHYIKERLHPPQMPIELAEKMIKRSSDKGGVVLDPFAGSGTTLLAAKNLERQWIGIEINPDNYEIAEGRLKPKDDSK